MPATEHHHYVVCTYLFSGAGVGQDHVGGDILCCLRRMEEADHHLPWQNRGPIGTQGTIAEDLANDRPEVWGWPLLDRALVGVAVLKWPAQ